MCVWPGQLLPRATFLTNQNWLLQKGALPEQCLQHRTYSWAPHMGSAGLPQPPTSFGLGVAPWVRISFWVLACLARLQTLRGRDHIPLVHCLVPKNSVIICWINRVARRLSGYWSHGQVNIPAQALGIRIWCGLLSCGMHTCVHVCVCLCVLCSPQELPEGGLHNPVSVCAITLVLRRLALIFAIPTPAQESYLLRRTLALPHPKLLLVPTLYDLGHILVSLSGKWGGWGTWKAGSPSVPRLLISMVSEHCCLLNTSGIGSRDLRTPDPTLPPLWLDL